MTGQGTTTARDHQWQLRTGTTKTADGELGLCKSLLKAANESSADSGSENVLTDENSEVGYYAYSVRYDHTYSVLPIMQAFSLLFKGRSQVLY